jgi:hypothetical protein
MPRGKDTVVNIICWSGGERVYTDYYYKNMKPEEYKRRQRVDWQLSNIDHAQVNFLERYTTCYICGRTVKTSAISQHNRTKIHMAYSESYPFKSLG